MKLIRLLNFLVKMIYLGRLLDYAKTSLWENPYRYDSDNAKYETLKYTQSTHFLVMNLLRQMK